MRYDGPSGMMLDLVGPSPNGVDLEWTHPYTSGRPYGHTSRPFSSHPYTYAENNPVNVTDPSGLFVGWGYGNYCGWNRRAKCPPGSGPKPIDAVDAACERHDCCVPSWKQCWKWTFCSAQICSDIWDAYYFGCEQGHPGNQPSIDACKQAAQQVGSIFCWQIPGVDPPEGGVSPG
jgi:hypothetical protein